MAKKEYTEDFELKGFTLPNRKVVLKPISRNGSFMEIKDHDGSFMYTGTFKEWCIFRKENGHYIDPLSVTERLYLEKELNEDLNVNHKENFWKKFTFKVKKTVYDLDYLKYEFDLSKPMDYIAYKLLLTAPDVANSYKEKDDTPEYRWVLIEQGEDLTANITTAKMKAACYKWFNENETKPGMLRDILWVMNVSVSKDNTIEELQNNVINIIENTSKIKYLYDTLNDPKLSTTILMVKCLKSGQIIIREGKYFNLKGQLIGMSKFEVLDFLANPENSLEVQTMNDKISKLNL